MQQQNWLALALHLVIKPDAIDLRVLTVVRKSTMTSDKKNRYKKP